MDLSENKPSFNELLEQINIINFNDDEIEIQRKIIEKTDFNTWEDYIQNRHLLFSNLVDLNSVINELVSKENNLLKMLGDINLIVNKNLNKSIIEEYTKWFSQLSTLTEENQTQFENFEAKLLNLYIRLIIDKNKNEPGVSNTIKAFFKDYKLQNELVKTTGFLNPSDYIDSISLPNLNKLIQNTSSNNFYFREKAHHLKNLYVALVKNRLIEPNEDFETLFEKEFNLKNKLNPIVWTYQKPVTQLLYLLYSLNDGGNVHRGYSISKIAYDLFKLKDTTTENSLKVNLNQVLYRFEEPLYIQRNMKTIRAILNSLNL